jgi:hypothetical protein
LLSGVCETPFDHELVQSQAARHDD